VVAMTARNEAYRVVDDHGETTLGSLDGSVRQGMSGGPIINDRGEVVGVITAMPRENSDITLSQEMRDTQFCQ
jgi:S1-C subfamily serine protease